MGEFGLIAAVTGRLSTGPAVLLGPGDDAAVVAAPDGRVVASLDLLVEGVHFRRDWSSAWEVGAKAAAQNCADIAAMGARPTALLVGLSAPPDLPVAWALGLSDGLRDEAGRAGAHVVGGDVTRGSSVVVSVTALGDLAGRAPVLRSGAQVGDVVVVAGPLGTSAAGLALLRAGEAAREGLVRFAQWHRSPRPDYAAGLRLAGAGARAMLDVSDGLVQDLGHITAASGVRIELDPGLLAPDVAALQPVAALLGQDPWGWVLAGGEDHSLVATLPQGAELPAGVRAIGRVRGTDPQAPGVCVLGREPPTVGGWSHYDEQVSG